MARDGIEPPTPAFSGLNPLNLQQLRRHGWHRKSLKVLDSVFELEFKLGRVDPSPQTPASGAVLRLPRNRVAGDAATPFSNPLCG